MWFENSSNGYKYDFFFFFIWRLRRRNLLDQTKGYIELGQEKKVCNVIREVYGLKKAPKTMAWKFSG